jgi:2-polyprenyl-3-methyl-5-hydroxy-6-metoxy-1,4-benzoquinol methylase
MPKQPTYPEAVPRVLHAFADNPWFTKTYWPWNEPRLNFMTRLVTERFPRQSQILEVGCVYGYIAQILQFLGYSVDVIDAYNDVHRDTLFKSFGVRYRTPT